MHSSSCHLKVQTMTDVFQKGHRTTELTVLIVQTLNFHMWWYWCTVFAQRFGKALNFKRGRRMFFLNLLYKNDWAFLTVLERNKGHVDVCDKRK